MNYCCFTLGIQVVLVTLSPFDMKKMFDTESTCGGRVEQEKVVNEGQEEVILAVIKGAWSILV